MSTAPTRTSPLTPLLLRLERTRGLDRLVAAADPLMKALTADETVRDALQGRWLSHAIHPLLVEVPIGTWTSALLVDTCGVDPRGRSTQLLTAVGLLAAVPTALTGWAELAEGDTRDKRVGVVHAAANGAGVVLQAAAYAARARGARATARGLAVAAMGIVGVAGLLGGHLAVVRDVGSHDPALDDSPEATRAH